VINLIDYKIWGKIQQCVYCTKLQDVNDLMQHLIDLWAGVEQNITDDAIDQWHRRLHACIPAKGGHFEYPL